MRTLIIAVLAVAPPAYADDTIAGTYDVKIEETASTCSPKPESFAKGKVQLAIKKSAVTVKFDAIYQMVGTVDTHNHLDAKTAKLIGTTVGGLSARYSVAGRAGGGTLDLALTAEYIRQDTNKPYCKQMWQVSGALAK
jgi:type 1 fimbria pilin